MSQNKNFKWIGISGTWRTTAQEVEKDVRSVVKEIIQRGDGIVTGGTFGVDFFALDEALKYDLDATHIKIVLPSTFENYIGHLNMWAGGHDTGDPAITQGEADVLIAQLEKFRNINSSALVEDSNVGAKDINGDTYFARNTAIMDLSDEVMAFQVNDSRGTQDTIDKARAAGKPVFVKKYKI